MTGIKDFAAVCRSVGPKKFLLRVYNEINDDDVFTHAAAMAYAWVFAIFPLLIFVLTLVPYVPTHVQRQTHHRLEKLFDESGMPAYVKTTVLDNVDRVMTQTHGGLLSIGLLLTLYAASGGMNMTMSALDEALEIEKPRPFIWKRLMAMALTLSIGLCFFVVVLMLPVGTSVIKLLQTNVDKLPEGVRIWMTTPVLLLATLVRFVIGLTAMFAMIGLLYRFGPSKKLGRFRLFTPGTIFVLIGWIGTGAGLRVYFAHFDNYSKTYGTVAGMVIMLLVFYLDATIVLVGAEIDSEVIKIKQERNPPLSV